MSEEKPHPTAHITIPTPPARAAEALFPVLWASPGERWMDEWVGTTLLDEEGVVATVVARVGADTALANECLELVRGQLREEFHDSSRWAVRAPMRFKSAARSSDTSPNSRSSMKAASVSTSCRGAPWLKA